MNPFRLLSLCRPRSTAGLLLPLLAVACGEGDALTSGGSGSLRVILEPEDTITAGVAAEATGTGIRDGWAAKYERFIVSVGGVGITSVDHHTQLEDSQQWVVDLKRLKSGGESLWAIEDVPAGRWQFAYALSAAGKTAKRHSSVTDADFRQLQDKKLTHSLAFTLSKIDGVSCPPAQLAMVGAMAPSPVAGRDGALCYANPSVRVEINATVSVEYGPCERDGASDFSVPAGGSKAVAATLHGDHIFFNGFPEGDESGVARYAQWLADSDLNVDGLVTEAELSQIQPADLAELDGRYQRGGAPVSIENMWEYVAAQLSTEGHFEGEGDCQISHLKL